MEEILRDHFEECFEHFLGRCREKMPRSVRNRTQRIKPFSEFCGVSPATALRWLDDGDTKPIGTKKIRAMCYLDLHGYKVIELESMSATSIGLRGFVELMGFGLLNVKEAVRVLQCSCEETVYRIVFVDVQMTKQKQEAIWEYWKGQRAELDRVKKLAFEKSALPILSSKPVILPPVLPQTPVKELVGIKLNQGGERQVSQTSLVGLLQILFGVSVVLDCTEITAEEMKAVSTDDVIRLTGLSTRLNTLGATLLKNRG